jgi:hypothetical protein
MPMIAAGRGVRRSVAVGVGKSRIVIIQGWHEPNAEGDSGSGTKAQPARPRAEGETRRQPVARGKAAAVSAGHPQLGEIIKQMTDRAFEGKSTDALKGGRRHGQSRTDWPLWRTAITDCLRSGEHHALDTRIAPLWHL